MNLVKCDDVPEQISSKTFDPFINIAQPNHSFVHEKFEDLRSNCSYYSTSHGAIPFDPVPHQLNILHLNARSICSNERFDDFQLFLEKSGCVWQIICISETWLYDHVAVHREMPGFTAYFSNRNDRPGGGVALYINNKYIKNSCLQKNIEVKCTQSLLVECQVSNTMSFAVGLVYKAPDLDNLCFLDELCAYLAQVNSLKKSAFIAGDFNFDLLNIDTDKAALDFFNVFASHGFLPTISKTTRASEDKLSLLDNIFSNNIDLVSMAGIIFDDISDHFPIFTSCTLQLSAKAPSTTRRMFDQQKLPEFREYLVNELKDFCSIEDPNEASNSLVNAYKLGIDRFSINIKCTRKTSAIKPWISSAILNSINTRNVLFKEKHKKPTKKNKDLYTKHRNCLNAVIREAKRKYIQEQLVRSQDDTRKVWNILKTVAKGSSCKAELPKQFTDSYGRVISKSSDIAESFNNFFVSVGEELQNEISKSTCSPLDHVRHHDSQILQELQHTNVTELHHIIKDMKNVGAGVDGINGNIFKKTYSSITSQLVHLVNICLSKGTFPDNMKLAVVKPIYKTGNKNSMSNYRPISILPYISKILEKIIYNRISEYLSDEHILSPNQFGFQRTLSTYMPMLLLQEQITKALEKGNVAVAIYLDLKKAFDTVDPNILSQKLKLYGIQGTPLKLIQSYLSDRYQCVEYDRIQSNLSKIRVGVPQGSILGPLLFLLYINDLPNVCTSSSCLLYADDTVLIFENSDRGKLQADLDKDLPAICEWLNANKLSLNTKKTVYQLYTYSQTSFELNITLNKEVIETADKVKYLGIVIDPHLKWNFHINHISTIISRNIGFMNRAKFYLNKQSLILLYNALVLPYINYCCIIWGFTFPSYVHKIEILQKKAVRIIDGQHRLAHADPIFHKLSLLKVYDIAKQQLMLLMYRKLCSSAPKVFDDLFMYTNPKSYKTRHRQHFHEPFCKKHFRTRVCTWTGPRIWNIVISPNYSIEDIRELSKCSMKKVTKKYFLSGYSPFE